MTRVMIINHGSTIGGAGLTICSVAKLLSKRYDVLVYTYDKPMDIANMLDDAGVVSKTFPTALGTIPYFSGGPRVCSMVFLKGILYAFCFARRWKGIISAEAPDVLIVSSKLLCWYSLLARQLGVKCICYVQETAPDRGKGLWNRVIRYFLERCDGVVFISDYDRRVENLKHPVTITMPNFISPSDYTSDLSRQEACSRLGIDPDSFNLLYVGGISKAKGFDVAVEALRYLKGRQVTLIVAGQGFDVVAKQRGLWKRIRYLFAERGYVSEMSRLLRDDYLAERVHFVGVRKDMADVYAASDVLLFPARNAHQARPAFEIGVQKKPVIISDFEMTREYVRDGLNGLTFEPHNPQSLAQAIGRLMDDDDLYRTLGESNYRQTMSRHVIEHAEGLLYGGIESVLGSPAVLWRV